MLAVSAAEWRATIVARATATTPTGHRYLSTHPEAATSGPMTSAREVTAARSWCGTLAR